ncbi:Small integral membrane protein [Selenomonas ruminantium]|uniref:Small integral membrane protein n=1 Tax=Selenomonas ruminantium TaxID=971 RepID=A0A1M6WIM1_SELRU|nr:DUF2273 domain-containing protein [Selenomonas ruminantium]SHK93547.1 Small integral membrane protein [Selenomonas ruminantium]
MKEEFEHMLTRLWQDHRGKTLGFGIGMLLGTAVLIFGFWHTFFVICCGLIGLFIGCQLDNGEDAVERVREKAWQLFERFQR